MRSLLQSLRAWIQVDSFFSMIARLTMVAVVIGMIIWAFGFLTGTLLNRPPKDGKSAFEKLEIPSSYRLRSESIRVFTLGGDDHPLKRLAFAEVDRGRGRYILDLKGYDEHHPRIYYDGKRVLEEGEDGTYTILKDAPSMAEVAGPTKAELQKMDPRLLDNDTTYAGSNKRAWALQFKPQCKDIRQWMMWDGLRHYTTYLPETEYANLGENKCKVKWAYMFIDHKTHYPLMIDLYFSVDKEVSYRYLFKYGGFDSNRLRGLNIEKTKVSR